MMVRELCVVEKMIIHIKQSSLTAGIPCKNLLHERVWLTRSYGSQVNGWNPPAVIIQPPLQFREMTMYFQGITIPDILQRM